MCRHLLLAAPSAEGAVCQGALAGGIARRSHFPEGWPSLELSLNCAAASLSLAAFPMGTAGSSCCLVAHTA